MTEPSRARRSGKLTFERQHYFLYLRRGAQRDTIRRDARSDAMRTSPSGQHWQSAAAAASAGRAVTSDSERRFFVPKAI